MSEPVTSMKGAASTDGIAAIKELGPLGMITLRGDLQAKALRKAATSVTGVEFPDIRQCHCDGTRGIAWMSPDEVLVMCDYANASDAVEQMNTALAGSHALVANVSDARGVFEISGPSAREVMAKLAPVDLHPSAFAPGMFRRSRLAQVPAAFWMPAEDVFHVVCFRSVAQYVFDVLSVAAQPGAEVGAF